jgi:uncharacterized membrane protein YbhN (UPF0104 family)
VADPAAKAASRSIAWRVVAAILFFAVLIFFGIRVARDWGAISGSWSSLHPNWSYVLLSGAIVLTSYVVLIETWRRTVAAWGSSIAWPTAARIWFVSNLGKYLPGKVWQIGAMGVLAQQAGVSPVAAVGSSLVVNLVNLLAGALVVLVFGARGLAGPGLVPLTVLALIGAIATPWLIPWMLEVAREVTGRDLPDAHVPPSAIFLALVGCMLSWALYGAAFQLLAVGLFGASSGTTPSYIAAFTLSYLIGYLALFAPGGLGVRETVLAGLLVAAGLDVDPNATILVLFSRLWMTLLEAAPGLVLIALSRARPITATATATATTPNGSHA